MSTIKVSNGDKTPLTAGQLLEALKKVPADSHVTVAVADAYTYEEGFLTEACVVQEFNSVYLLAEFDEPEEDEDAPPKESGPVDSSPSLAALCPLPEFEDINENEVAVA